MCKRVKVDKYVNAIGGQSIYDKRSFEKTDMEFEFLGVADVEYKQFYNEFVPHISVIDVLMFNSKVEANKLLNQFVLK